MNTESLNLAPTPCDEPCAQVGSNNYPQQSRIELKAFKAQLYRILDAEFGIDNVVVSLVRVSHPHDFGSYHDIEVKYDCDDETSIEQAFWLEDNLPENWDNQAQLDLIEAGYEFAE